MIQAPIIYFVKHGDAFLPEINHYKKFFLERHIICEEVGLNDLPKNSATNIEWHFMGLDIKSSSSSNIKIHEYASSSLPPFEAAKNFIKKNLNSKPDYRIFLNEYVKRSFGFRDNIPYGFRDMGCKLVDVNKHARKIYDYDFIYVGEVSSKRGFNKWIRVFIDGNLKDKKILVLSKNYDIYKKKFKKFQNIVFMGPILQSKVPDMIQSAQFALNMVPNVSPFCHQTSTKFLEYAACGVPIITTDYTWAREFQIKHGGNYFFIDDLRDINFDQLIAYNFSNPTLDNFDWNSKIIGSNVLIFLRERFPNVKEFFN